MYFLIVAALVGGVPQSIAGVFADKTACERKKPEIVALAAADAGAVAFAVECVQATVPGKQL